MLQYTLCNDDVGWVTGRASSL